MCFFHSFVLPLLCIPKFCDLLMRICFPFLSLDVVSFSRIFRVLRSYWRIDRGSSVFCCFFRISVVIVCERGGNKKDDRKAEKSARTYGPEVLIIYS